jgi:hypothetical protein
MTSPMRISECDSDASNMAAKDSPPSVVEVWFCDIDISGAAMGCGLGCQIHRPGVPGTAREEGDGSHHPSPESGSLMQQDLK